MYNKLIQPKIKAWIKKKGIKEVIFWSGIMLGVILAFIVMLIILSFPVRALDCSYDSNPYLSRSIDFVCLTTYADTSKCIGLISYNDSLIHVYPEIKDILITGRIQYFESRNSTKLVNVQFKSDELYAGMSYEFKVICASMDGNAREEFSTNLTMVNPTWSNIPARGIWLKDNINVIIFIIMIVIFLVVIFSMWKGKRG